MAKADESQPVGGAWRLGFVLKHDFFRPGLLKTCCEYRILDEKTCRKADKNKSEKVMIDSCPLDVAESLCLLKKEWISEVKHDIRI